MKILIAPDKFKGSLSAEQVCQSLARAISATNVGIEITCLPLADGGDGFEQIFGNDPAFKKINLSVQDPRGRDIESHFLYNQKTGTAVLEMANFSGLQLLGETERNPLYTSTIGTGQAIAKAIKLGAEHIVLGIGGSATNDAGMGLATVLGYSFLDAEGRVLKPLGHNLAKVSQISMPKAALVLPKITIACDVQNVLYGHNGAAHVYAPQKGANTQEVALLDHGLRHFAQICTKTFGTNYQQIPGTGAAGGIGYGMLHFVAAQLRSGIDIILDYLHFDTVLAGHNLVITGEGKIDHQTLQGKVLAGVCQRARAQGIPVIGVCGKLALQPEQLQQIGISAVYEIMNLAQTEAEAINHAGEYLSQIGSIIATDIADASMFRKTN
jgi:glycerate 2-kinase